MFGARVTLIVHEAPGANVVQLLVCLHEEAWGPSKDTELMVRGPVPALETVSGNVLGLYLDTLPKFSDVGLIAISGTPPLPPWVSVKVFPAIVTVPVLFDEPLFEATE